MLLAEDYKRVEEAIAALFDRLLEADQLDHDGREMIEEGMEKRREAERIRQEVTTIAQETCPVRQLYELTYQYAQRKASDA